MKYLKTYTICLLMIAVLFSYAVKGANAQIAIPANITLGAAGSTISKNIWGVDFQSLVDLGPPPTNTFNNYIRSTALQTLGATMYRFPGSCGGDSYDSQLGTLATGPVPRQYLTIPEALAEAQNTPNGELLYQVNINSNNALEVPSTGTANVCGEISQVNKDNAALLAEITTIVTTYPLIQYFQLGSSQWFHWTPAEYRTQAIAFAQAIKAANPNAQVGLVGYPSLAPDTDTRKAPWNQMINDTRTATCGAVPCFDFVTDSQYPKAQYTPPAFSGLASYYAITNQAHFQNVVNSYPGIEYGLTEWNLSCGNPNPTLNPAVSMAGSVDHGIFTFTNLFVMAENNVSMANYHDLTVGNACGLFSDPITQTATGQAFALSSVAAGGQMYTISYDPSFTGFLTIPANTGCLDPDCINIQTGNLFSILSTYAVQQGNDLYIFLVNRSDSADTVNETTINATINIPTWPNYDKQIVMEQLAASSFGDPVFFPIPIQTIANQTTSQFQADLLPTSITRIRIVDHFVGAPAPTPTSAILPSNNLTVIQKLLNLKRTEVRKCTQDVLMFIVASAVYIMVIRFAIAINEDFKLFLHVSCFVIGGVIGYYICNLEVGFVIAVVLSLFLW